MDHDEVLHDTSWRNVARRIARKSTAATVFGPYFLRHFIKNPLLTYQSSYMDGHARFAVLYKSQLNQIGPEKLKRILRYFYPIFANEDFVLYDKKRPWPWQRLRLRNRHFLHFLECLAEMVQVPGDFYEDRTIAPYRGNDRTAFRCSSYLGDHLILTRLANGLGCYLDTRDQSLTPKVLLDGIAHPYIIRYFESCVQTGDTVVDVGANNGYFTLILGGKVGAQGKLIVFEANPRLAGLIHNNLGINGFTDRTVFINKAVADCCGPMTLNVFQKYQGSSTFGALPPDYARSFYDEIEQVEVEAVTLDSYFGDAPPRIDIIKLDIEGFEPQALRGAQKVLASQQRLLVFCEFNPASLQYCGNSPRAFLRELHELGFNRQVLETSGKLSEKTDDEILQMCQGSHVDLILTRGRDEVAACF